MTAQFHDLSVEILPVILGHLRRRNDVHTLLSVNKLFNTFAAPLLYEEIYIYAWHKDWKGKLRLLLQTLADSPHLARYVKVLSLREFPRWQVRDAEYYDFYDIAVQGLANCRNLRSCTWTRDGTLSSEILQTLIDNCPHLEELELNGHTGRYYDPRLLLHFKSLSRISVIMPDRTFADVMPEWIALNGDFLKKISFISKSTPVITDNLMEEISLSGSFLEEIHLVGNPRVTPSGVATVTSASPHLRSLSLEGPDFDMICFSKLVSGTPLRNLTSISVTHPASFSSKDFFDGLLSVLAHSPLKEFQIWRPGGDTQRTTILPIDFVKALVVTHGHRLTKFAVQRMETSMQVITYICRRCSVLEQLLIVLGTCDFDALATKLRQLTHLQTLHLSYTPYARNAIAPMQLSRMEAFVKQCPPSLQLFGSLSRVFEIQRTWEMESRDPLIWSKEPTITLGPYGGQQIPEAFLVMKA